MASTAGGSSSSAEALPTAADVTAAAARIAGRVRRTPVLASEEIGTLCGAQVFFKCENLQHGGAFKLRGAMNAVWSCADDVTARGFATHSSGNHGAALARAARSRGVPAYVVVPEGASALKLDNIREQGGELRSCAPTLAAREAAFAQVLAETGAASVHPFNDARVIAGQGTAALELLDEQPDLDMLLLPVGGGGLISGSALVAAARGVEVFGAEPAGAADAQLSLRAGRRVTDVVPDTIADGLRATIGTLTFALIRRHVKDVLLVDEDEIRDATRLMWRRLRLLVEPSSAVPVAALLRHRERFAGKRVGIVITGGNVDPEALP